MIKLTSDDLASGKISIIQKKLNSYEESDDKDFKLTKSSDEIDVMWSNYWDNETKYFNIED